MTDKPTGSGERPRPGQPADERAPIGPRLDDQVCFALYAASRAATAAYRPHLDELGVTYPQYLVMLVLWERGAVPVKELAAALRLDYGTLSPLLKRLEGLGLLRRERRPEDERSVLVSLTGRGGELRERARRVPDALQEASGMPREAAERLRRELLELADRLTEAAASRR
ncbi:MarR family winged helix-turn-helix transcriptional regulator [Streptomyces palmae]|uniref:MarR family winged helix-turn-helix transcriptional regulator n=1 Tax=Streptomyces palmae TaxID=1701085 RepID=UPI0035E72325